ncbi:hypothetical protein, conserved [Leishmania lindenbergi]|uniref:Uncharacterized protein n=1 Tax=Leishmania lindenbergi TaxID=651832 RepID=A0AAW3B1D3_9TRYP
MSFTTKFAMWWGSVTTKTENLFNKEKQRLVAHEYYDNPNPKSARQKSMHSIRGSMRAAGSTRSFQSADDTEKRSKSSHQQQERKYEGTVEQISGYSNSQYSGAQQGQYMQDPQYMHQQQYQGYPNQGYNQAY